MQMPFFLQILFLFFSTPPTWALQSIEIGSKHPLKRQNDYHFSSKKLVSVHINTTNPFLIGLNIGDLKFRENGKRKRLLILNPTQQNFFKQNDFLVSSSPFLDWSVESEKLIVTGTCSQQECLQLFKTCKNLDSPDIFISALGRELLKNSLISKACLGIKDSYQLDIAILNEDSLSGNTYGVGIPTELSWVTNPKIKFGDIKGAVNANHQKTKAKGHVFFSSSLGVGEKSVFESGSEVLIRPSGVFNRQQNEWKTATSKIETSLLDLLGNNANITLKLNRTERTGDSKIFNVERFEQKISSQLGVWTKAFVFQQDSKGSAKTKIIGFSLLGSRKKSKNDSLKQAWVRVSKK